MNDPAIDSECLEGLCAAALDVLPRTVVVSDHETILFANSAAARAFGAKSAAELIGLGVEELLHPDCRAAAAQRRELLATSRRELHGLPMKILCRDGSAVTTTADAHPIEFDGRSAFVYLNQLAVPEERAS